MWGKLFTIGIGTNITQRKNTEPHICRLRYYLLLKSNTELLHNFDDFKISQYHFWDPALLSCNYQRQFYWSKKRKNSLMINSWNVKSPIRYRKHTEQTHKFLLPLLRSWCNRWIRATIGQKKERPTTADEFKNFHEHCRRNEFAISLLLRKIKIILDLKFFLIGSVYSCFQTPRAGKSIRWNKLPCRSIGKRVSETRSTTELTCSTACAKTIHYWKWDKHRWVKNYTTRHL